MKFNRALLIPTLLAFPLASCGGSPKQCETVPGLSHSYPPATGRTYVGANLRAAAPGPDWMWLEGCWYWNGTDWAWLETQWMPPGGQMNYVGPQDSRNDYCVYQPTQSYVLPVAMPWPPDAGLSVGYAVQEVVVGGEYGSRHPGNWQTGAVRDHRGDVRDHRGDSSGRRNEVVPARRGKASRPDYDFDEPYLGPGPAARPPAVSPPTPPRYPRPEAPTAGPVAPTAPPVVTRPPRPSAPPQGPAEQPPRRVRHDPPVSAPPPRPAPPVRPQAPVSRPAAPAPAPARPAPPPRAAPRPTPPAAAPARPAAPPSRGTAPSRGRRR